MAPFQLRVRTLYPRTQPVPSTPLSIRLGPPPTSDVHPGEVRTQHVGSTRRPLSPELRATTPPHRTPGTQRAGLTHLPGEVHLHSLGSLFILVLGHGLMSRSTHRSPPCRNVDVKVSSSQSDRPITPVGLRWRPAPDRAHQLRPPTLCLPGLHVGLYFRPRLVLSMVQRLRQHSSGAGRCCGTPIQTGLGIVAPGVAYSDRRRSRRV